MFLIGIIALCLFLVFYFTSKENFKNNEVNISNNMNINNDFVNKENIIIKESKKNNFNAILNIGVFLIILSSVVFSTSTWNIYEDKAKVIILGVETLLFLGLGILLKYVFDVKKSGNALTFISAVLFFITFLSIGYFKLFGYDFSIFGKHNYFFLGTAFFIELIILYLRKLLIKSDRYFTILLCFFTSMFLFIKGITGNFILSFALISVLLLIISIIKRLIFKKSIEFDIFNYILIGILTIFYISSNVYHLLSNNTFLLEHFSLIILLISLSINFIFNVGKKNEVLNILSIIYESFLVIWFVMFSKNIMTSSLALIISGFVLYIIYYLSKNKYISLTSLIISYIQGILGIIFICFDKTYVILAPIISFSYIILTFISSLKKDNTIILNSIFEPIYLVLFAIGILIQPSIINKIRPIDIIMVINICLIIVLIASTILKNNIKNSYFIILLFGLFIQIICSIYTELIYLVIALIINFILILYSYFSNDSFYKKCSFYVSLLFIINLVIGLGKYNLISAFLVFICILLFMCITKNNKKRFTYVSLLFIPIFQIINIINIRLSLREDLMLLIILPFIYVFSRKVIESKEESGMCVFELSIFSLLCLNINNDISALLYLIILYVIMYVLSFRYQNSSKVYLNYLLFLTPVIFFALDSGIYEVLYMICLLSSLIINQILYRIIFEKRSLLFEIFHSIICLFLMISLISTMPFNSLLSSVISVILIMILYLIYENQKMRYVVLSFIIYPLSLIIKYIPYHEVSIILNVFIWMIPLTIFLRKVFKVDKNAISAIESITLSLMFLLFIFSINIYVGITLGVISILIIIIGLIFKYKSFSYVGYVTLIITIIIQTINLWGSIPWWVYLLISGIILVIVAAVIESKKK